MRWRTARRRRWTRWPVLVAVLVVALVAAGGGYLAADTGGGRSAPPSATPPVPTRTPVLAPRVAPHTLPTTAGLIAAIGAAVHDPHLGADVAAVVVDPATGRLLYDAHGTTPLPPASTNKIVTAVAALSSLGPQDTLRTRTVLDGDTVVLVGGGDPTLTAAATSAGYPQPASLPALADRTAAALRARGTTTVGLGWDATLYVGPDTAPGWSPSYVSEGDVAPVTALELDEGRVAPPADRRSPDPARAATEAFARLLHARGITVTGSPAAHPAPAAAAPLAAVESPPVGALVERMLTVSDNDLAEALLRQIALHRGRPASFAGGTAAVADVLHGLRLDTTGLSLQDGSGLSRADRIPPLLLTRLVSLAASPSHPELRHVLTGLPVAGFTGTLADRYRAGPASAGAGAVRAKTGTLSGVSTLTGLVADRDGTVLAFSLVAPHAPYYVSAEAALDRVAAQLAGCGCR